MNSISVAAELEELDEQVASAISAAWADNTKKCRNSQWKNFYEFCGRLKLCPLPASPQTVVRFLVFKARSCKYSTINNYLSAISTLHKYYGYPAEFRESYMVQLVLEGLKSQLGTAVSQKDPLTPKELLMMFKIVSSPQDHVMWAAVVFSFRTLLRKSNVLPESKHDINDKVVIRRDIEFVHWGMIVHVRATKTLKYRERTLRIPVCTVKDSPLCAVSALRKHFHDCPAPGDSPIFVFHNGSLVLYSHVMGFLKRLSALIGKDPDSVGLHSLRRSGAQFLHQIGVPLEDIKSVGDWSSWAVLMYLISPFERKVDIDMYAAKMIGSL